MTFCDENEQELSNKEPSVPDFNELAEICETMETPEFNAFFEENIYPEINKRYKRYCHKRICENDAEDIIQAALQDVFFYLRAKKYSSQKGNFTAWCYTLLKNKFSRFYKARKRYKSAEDDAFDNIVDYNNEYNYGFVEEDIKLNFFPTKMRHEMDLYLKHYSAQSHRNGSHHYPSYCWLWLRLIGMTLLDHLQKDRSQTPSLMPWNDDEKVWRFQKEWPILESIWLRMKDELPLHYSQMRYFDDLLQEMVHVDTSDWYNLNDRYRTRVKKSLEQCKNDISETLEYMDLFFLSEGYHNAKSRGKE